MSIQINNLPKSSSEQLVELTVNEAIAINGGIGIVTRAAQDMGGGGSVPAPQPAPSLRNLLEPTKSSGCGMDLFCRSSGTPDPFRLPGY